MLFLSDFAELAEVAVDTLRAYRTRSAANFPAADGQVIEGQHVRPFWYESTARQWLASRPRWGRPNG